MTEALERSYEWDDEISADGGFVDLPDGDYPFTIVSFDRERHGGSAKLPPCNKAVLHIEVDGGEKGKAMIKSSLFLHSKTEGLLCAFFTSIGQRKHGETLKMDWSKVPGSAGWLRLGRRSFVNDKGETVSVMDIKKFLDGPPEGVGSSYTDGAF